MGILLTTAVVRSFRGTVALFFTIEAKDGRNTSGFTVSLKE